MILGDAIVDAVVKWRNIREEIFAAGEAAEAKAMSRLFDRLGVAEHELMTLARIIGKPTPISVYPPPDPG